MTIVPKTFGEPRTSPEVLLDALFRPLGADGVYGRTARYEAVVEALAALISRHRDPGAEVLRFPPVVSRALIEKSGYLKSFPHLLGCVCSLTGGEREIGAAVDRFVAGQDWTNALSTGDLVLAPAACYPVYPIAASAADPGRRPDFRCRLRLLPPGALARHRPLPIVPHARICVHRRARAGPGVSRALDDARDGHRRRSGPQLPRGNGKRPVLRTRRGAGRQGSGAAGVEIRIAGAGPLRRTADRLHELQLSPRPFRIDLEHAQWREERSPTPAASPSAWTV